MALTRLQLRHALFGALDPTAGSSGELLMVGSMTPEFPWR
jgi:hypothetical protein